MISSLVVILFAQFFYYYIKKNGIKSFPRKVRMVSLTNWKQPSNKNTFYFWLMQVKVFNLTPVCGDRKNYILLFIKI